MSRSALGVDSRVEVKTESRTYAGVILEIHTATSTDDIIQGEPPICPTTTTCKVKYYEFDDIVTLPLESLTSITAGYVKEVDVVLPYICQCKYATDGYFYDATITSKTKYGYIVTYTKYGNTEEVPLEYIRPIPPKKPSDPNALITIPAHLQIQPTDTEEEKARKKKKIKAIKAKNKGVEEEVAAKEAQQSWHKFVHKGVKRALPGVVKSSSLFASSDDVTSRVGIVNSGKGLTEFQTRKKHKFEA